jgi:hypothetical protein
MRWYSSHLGGCDRPTRSRREARLSQRWSDAAVRMTWDQAVTLLIMPGLVALVLGLGGIWLNAPHPVALGSHCHHGLHGASEAIAEMTDPP